MEWSVDHDGSRPPSGGRTTSPTYARPSGLKARILGRLRKSIAESWSTTSRKICAGVLQKVLMKVAFRNPGLNFTNVLKSLPSDADVEALKALVAPIVDKVSGIKRVEGDRVD